MMTNLFSIFDPSTGWGSGSSWISMVLGVLFLPLGKWVSVSRGLKFFYLITAKLQAEISLLLPLKSKDSILIFISLFYLILFNNMMGLTPYLFTATSHLSVTLSLVLPLWLGYFLFGWLQNTKWSLAHLVPQGTPVVLMPFMVLIEGISAVIRPGTLSVRLAANMIAGHLLLILMSGSVSVFSVMTGFGVMLAQVLLISLEVAVAMIQSYVLVVLSSLYTSEV